MRFGWDPKKKNTNKKKHLVSFETAQLIFNDPLALTISDGSHSIKEERWITIGRVNGKNPLLLVCHLYYEEGENEMIWIYSARKATSKETQQYLNHPRYTT